jgi:hypothetical protein
MVVYLAVAIGAPRPPEIPVCGMYAGNASGSGSGARPGAGVEAAGGDRTPRPPRRVEGGTDATTVPINAPLTLDVTHRTDPDALEPLHILALNMAATLDGSDQGDSSWRFRPERGTVSRWLCASPSGDVPFRSPDTASASGGR